MLEARRRRRHLTLRELLTRNLTDLQRQVLDGIRPISFRVPGVLYLPGRVRLKKACRDRFSIFANCRHFSVPQVCPNEHIYRPSCSEGRGVRRLH